MTENLPGHSTNRFSPYWVLLAAICFLLVLLCMTRPGVFFSGDGGLKYLIAKQLDHSRQFRYILSDHPQWVKQIWAEGYYPFQPPFVYRVNNDHMVGFPPFFEFLTAYFYKQFGYFGIYIIPAISLLLTWISFLGLLTSLRIRSTAKTLGLFMLTFCTPLSFYGAVYWEHSLGVFLLFNVVIYFFWQRSSLFFAVMSGLLSGMAVWYREETIVFLGLMMLVIAWNNRRFKNRADTFFIIATILPVLFYFLFNYQVYHSFFGLHGDQIIKNSSFIQQIWKGFKQLVRLNLEQLIYFPIIVCSLFVLLSLSKQNRKENNRLLQLALVIFLFMLITPFLVPSTGDKQWGARFFLPVIPPAVLLVTIFGDTYNWERLFQQHKKWATLLILVIIYSLFMNVYVAANRLRDDYSQRVYPALKYIQTAVSHNVIVDNQYISQELTEEFNTKNFFLLSDSSGLSNLLHQLKIAGEQQCIFISVDKEKTSFPENIRINKGISWQQMGSYSVGVYAIP